MKKEKTPLYNYHPELKAPPSSPAVDFNSKFVQFMMSFGFRKASKEVANYKIHKGLKLSSITIPCKDDTEIICYTIEKYTTTQNKPTILYFHGGGFVSPIQTVFFNNAAFYAEHLDCKIFIPEYRVLPRHPFPTPLQDCYDTLKYLISNKSSLNINLDKLILYGDSAGGCLAASLSHIIRDQNLIKLSGQMLIYPVVDNSFTFESMNTIKYAAWPSDSNKSIWSLYLKNGKNPLSKYAVPYKCDNFSGLPKAYVEPHEIDCLRDEAIAYSQKLKEAGVDTDLNIIKGSYHGADADHSSPYIQELLKHRVTIMQNMFQNS